jgi:hypothetical protein
MSFTRFHDDNARIKKQLEISTETGRYQLERPGQGNNLPFIEDPRIRLQYWGANLRNNTMHLDSDLRGITRKLTKDDKGYESAMQMTLPNIYSTQSSFIDETRTSLPAWTLRDLEQKRWDMSFHNTQEKTEILFEHNQHTRILEKDNYVRNTQNHNSY